MFRALVRPALILRAFGFAALCSALLMGAVTVAGWPSTARPAPSAIPSVVKAAQAAPASQSAPVSQLTPGLRRVDDFGPNPTGLGMYVYIPMHVSPHPAVVVAIHGCHQSGTEFYRRTEFAALADKYGFIVIYPSVTRTAPRPCFDSSSASALSRDGGSDPAGIVSMVRYAQTRLQANPRQVYVAGFSSGAMMTNLLLSEYPDVFSAGSAISGVPYGCFAMPDTSLWNSNCADGLIHDTPQRWGDLVRAADPDYQGTRPRVQLWYGTADAVLSYANFGQEVDQWTNVLRAHLGGTSQLSAGITHSVYVDSAGQTEVDAYSAPGQGHTLYLDFPDWARRAVEFFGLTTTAATGSRPR